MKSSNIGGQAVLEGIMMRNGGKYSVAVRKADGDIAVDVQDYKASFRGRPLLRFLLSGGFLILWIRWCWV